MDLNTELELSLYEELKIIHKSKKTEVILVNHTVSSKFYIKKILSEYTIDVYNTLKNLKSPHLPQIIDIFESSDKLIIIEEFISGQTLKQMLKTNGQLDEDTVIKYMISLCEVLSLLHNQAPPIIHRDIKPENIIISIDNVLKIIDFDISRTYKTGENLDTTLLGTKGYASPEQFGFEQSDGRSDIYAMGVMMNVLTTGKHFKEFLNDSKLRNVILKCTQISPKDRYEDVDKLKYDLELLLFKDNNSFMKKFVKKDINTDNNPFEKKDINKYNITFEKKDNSKPKSKSIIPGFRTKNKINMILATLFYLMLGTGLLAFTSMTSFISNVIVIVMCLMYVCLFANFMDIHEKLPLIKSGNKFIKVLGFIIYSFIIFMSLGSLLTLFS